MDFSYASSTYSQAISTKTLQNKDETHIKICVSELRTYLECINKKPPRCANTRAEESPRRMMHIIAKNIVSSSVTGGKRPSVIFIVKRKEDDYVG